MTEFVTLAECPPGLFLFGNTLGFKSEYMSPSTHVPGGYKVDAYVVESGEFFWGGTSNPREREVLLVQPMELDDILKRHWDEDAPGDPVPAIPAGFQAEVDSWMDACFGDTIKADQLERADRFIEEALELAQTMPGFGADRAHALVDYVFSRPVGDRFQEVGGVMVTLAALCNAAELDIHDAAAFELARVWTKVEAIRAKQAAKPTGSALPVAVAPEAGATA